MITELIDRLRLTAGTYISWIGLRIMPWPMPTLFYSYLQAVELLPAEIARGRTYGVMTAVWALNEDGFMKADQMRAAAMLALHNERWHLENPPPSNGNPCGEISLPPEEISAFTPKSGEV